MNLRRSLLLWARRCKFSSRRLNFLFEFRFQLVMKKIVEMKLCLGFNPLSPSIPLSLSRSQLELWVLTIYWESGSRTDSVLISSPLLLSPRVLSTFCLSFPILVSPPLPLESILRQQQSVAPAPDYTFKQLHSQQVSSSFKEDSVPVSLSLSLSFLSGNKPFESILPFYQSVFSLYHWLYSKCSWPIDLCRRFGIRLKNITSRNQLQPTFDSSLSQHFQPVTRWFYSDSVTLITYVPLPLPSIDRRKSRPSKIPIGNSRVDWFLPLK